MSRQVGAAEVERIASLLDWRRQVANLYRDVGAAARPEEAFDLFVARRDLLFSDHPQSPLDADGKRAFSGLAYYRYQPALRYLVEVDADVDPDRFEVALRDDGAFWMRRVGAVGFHHLGRNHRLSLFWIEGYGGGLFLPFRDATNGDATYGGGRYLLDTLKHADLGDVPGEARGEAGGGARGGERDAAGERRLILDFNFAYQPSCAYHPRWDCPLAPPSNRLQVAVEAGERLPTR